MLLKSKAFINNKWVDGEADQTMPVYCPCDDTKITTVPDMNATDAAKAVKDAHAAFQTWRDTTPRERSDLLGKLLQLLTANAKAIGEVLSRETGKPRQEGLGEVFMAHSYLELFAGEAKHMHGEVIPHVHNNYHTVCLRQPIGVVGMILPWNFPYAMVLRSAAAALAAGCTCVVKPAEDTPLATLALAHFIEQAGFPPGVFNVVTADRMNAAGIGKVLCESPYIAGVSFTGSTTVGKLLYQQCGLGVKRIALELGGNAPFIVFDTADVDMAVAEAVGTKFLHCGQACISPNRFYVHAKVYDEFKEKLVRRVQKLVLGKWDQAGVTTGPLNNDAQLAKVQGLVSDAVSKKAKVLCGGGPSPVGRLYFQPTVLEDIPVGAIIHTEEIFGPVVALYKFTEENVVVAMANDTPHGLAGYVYSGDMQQLYRVAKRLDVGMVGLNEVSVALAEVPFGGVKQSGFGKEGSRHGLDEFTYMKTLTSKIF